MTAPDASPVLSAHPLEIEPAMLDYSYGDTSTLAPARPAFVALLWVAILSGLCVGSCFLVLASNFSGPAIALHVLLYAVTLGIAVRGGVHLAKLNPPSFRSSARPLFDLVAGIGLLMIGIAPLVVDFNRSGGQDFAGVFLGSAFLLMAVTTPRHVMLYRGLADLAAAHARRGMAGWLRVLGWMKFVYEGLWLLCCSAPLAFALPESMRHSVEEFAIFAMFGAFFGCLGFTAIWIMMIVTHAKLVAMARPAPGYTNARYDEIGNYTGRAFEVTPAPVAPEVWTASGTRQP